MTNFPPPNPPAAQRPSDLPGLLGIIEADTLALKRAMSGYNHLAGVLSQVERGKLRQGERRCGLPIIRYAVPDAVDGAKAVEVVTDLRKLDPGYLPHVLSPLSHLHAVEMLKAVASINQASADMLGQIQVAMQPIAPQAGTVEEQEDVEEEPETKYEEEEVEDEVEQEEPQRPRPVRQRRAQG